MSEWIYKISSNNRARFILGEWGDNPLVCIGVNPSTASPAKLDNTMRVVKSRAKSLGYDGWIMINLYAQRATDPNRLHKNLHLSLHREHLNIIREVLGKTPYDIWVAWGTLIEKRKYLSRCVRDIYEVLGEDRNYLSIGALSVLGHPHHPLYLRKELLPEFFDLSSYIKRL